jgi:hypothetical protein
MDDGNTAADGLVEADDELIERLEGEFEKNFAWVPGEYEAVFKAETDKLGAIAFKYRFTLYESDVESMREAAHRHRYGFGVVPTLVDSNIVPVMVDLTRSQ